MKKMSELLPGDQVWSLDASGKIVRDEILAFMDIQHDVIEGIKKQRIFVSIKTESGKTIKLTQNHLIFKKQTSTGDIKHNITSFAIDKSSTYFPPIQQPLEVSFASKARPGELIFVVNFSSSFSSATLRPETVLEVNVIESASGAFAPLTRHGSIVVNDVVASCYAVVESHRLAHTVMMPIRYFHSLRKWLSYWTPNTFYSSSNASALQATECKRQQCDDEGVILYAKFLHYVGSKIIPSYLFWGD